MSDLISRQAAINAIENTDCELTPDAWDELTNAIMKVPTVDAVPVVRCKDCKHRPIDTGGHNYGQDLFFPNDYKCPCRCGDQWYSWMPQDDWFCSNGERAKNNPESE